MKNKKYQGSKEVREDSFFELTKNQGLNNCAFEPMKEDMTEKKEKIMKQMDKMGYFNRG